MIDPLFYLIAMGFGVGAYLTNINGMSYTTFVITGLIGATAMTTATSEATVNAFIQYKIEKTVNDTDQLTRYCNWPSYLVRC